MQQKLNSINPDPH